MTLRLHQTFGAHTGRTYVFDQDLVRAGRMPDCDVTFDPHADLDASGRHAEFRRETGQWFVVDTGSRNGTWINGQRIDRHVLVHGDEVEFGPGGPRLKVELTPNDIPTARGAPATPVPLGASTGPMTGVPQTTPPPPPAMPQEVVAPPKRYGERTAGLMIRKALDRAGASRGLKVAVVILALLLGVTLAVLGYLVLANDKPGPLPDGGHVAAANAGALFRLVEVQQGGGERTLCSGFAVRRDVVATTARCVLAVEARRASGSTVDLRGVSGPATATRMYRHPHFVDGSEGADVGLIQIATPAPSIVTLSTLEHLHGVESGAALLLYGYSGEVARTVPTTVEAVGGDAQVRRFTHTAIGPAGAPVFDPSGAVVGLHSTGPAGAEPAAEGPGYVVGADALMGLLLGLPTQ